MAQVLREAFGLSYKKVIHTAYLANTDRSRVLRMKFAKMMLPLLASGKRLINLDESTIPFLDYHRYSWSVRGQRNTYERKDLAPKVNLIAAIDTEGRVYAAITQINTTSEIMVSFLSRLATILKAEDPSWAKSTVLVLDGAKYHTSSETRKILR